MKNNYFVSYDLIAPGQHYGKVITAIKETGNWAQVEYSFFYVRSGLTIEALAKHVWNAMTSNDKLIVIDASNNNFAGYNIDQSVLNQMLTEWKSV